VDSVGAVGAIDTVGAVGAIGCVIVMSISRRIWMPIALIDSYGYLLYGLVYGMQSM
jgi:hypothetical protein